MRAHRDPSHVPRPPPPVLVEKNERGEFEVRVNNTGRDLLGTFPNRTMVDLFIEMIVSMCGPNGCSCGDLETHLATAA